jgi:hypothetical protein
MMSKYNISMGDVQNCAIGPGAQVIVTPGRIVPVTVSIDDDILNRAIDKAHDQDVSLDSIITVLLIDWIEQDDEQPEEVVMTFTQYIRARARAERPITWDRNSFWVYCTVARDGETGPQTEAEWDRLWDAYVAAQDAQDERDTQQDALR